MLDESAFITDLSLEKYLLVCISFPLSVTGENTVVSKPFLK